jgi:hypothetical protein
MSLDGSRKASWLLECKTAVANEPVRGILLRLGMPKRKSRITDPMPAGLNYARIEVEEGLLTRTKERPE